MILPLIIDQDTGDKVIGYNYLTFERHLGQLANFVNKERPDVIQTYIHTKLFFTSKLPSLRCLCDRTIGDLFAPKSINLMQRM